MSAERAFTIDDPQSNAAEAPYTFFLPSPQELAALAPGDLAKLIFRPIGGDRKWGAERMWVTIDRADGERLEGTLGNEPEDMPGLQLGDRVSFLRHQVIDYSWAEPREREPPTPPLRREYWERCMVDRCVIEAGVQVHYLYREDPDLAGADDRYPDSGWRIRGDYRDLSDEEIDAREPAYVAIGVVLNADDSWLHLVDAPIGSAFIREWATGEFIPYDGET